MRGPAPVGSPRAELLPQTLELLEQVRLLVVARLERDRLLVVTERVAPVGAQQVRVAEMLRDDRIATGQDGRALEGLDRHLELLAGGTGAAGLEQLARAHVVDPAEGVDDEAVLGPGLERAADHLLRFVELLAALRERVSDVVQRAGVI